MTTITLTGDVYRAGIAQTPVVFIVPHDQQRLTDWWQTQHIFTKLLSHSHPVGHAASPVIYVTERAAQPFVDGTRVRIVIAVRPEKRGNGIKIIDVQIDQ